jgi:competence protein ComEC
MILISICLAWVAGVLIGSYLDLSWIWMISGFIPMLMLLFFKQYRKPLLILALAIIAFFGGTAYYPTSLPQDNIVAEDNSQPLVEISGSISAPPEIRGNNSHIELTVSKINNRPVTGRVLLFTPRYPGYKYGDVIQVKGRLVPPPQLDEFDYQAHLAREGIYATLFYPDIRLLESPTGFSALGWIYETRQRLSDSLAAALPEPQAGLAQGILLGIRTTISPDLQNELSVTGTAHLIAISGINLSIIAGIIVALGIRLFGRRHYYYIWLSLVIVWFYSLLTGLQAPVIRSAIMASVFLLAEVLGRQKWALPCLALSAAVMVGLNPQVMWSVSFQLSFLAMVGLIFITPFFQDLAANFVTNRWEEDSWVAKLVLPVTDSFSVSLGAVIAIWPVVAYNFGVVSLVGPLTTFLIAPALTPIIILCALTALTGLFSPPAAQVIGWSGWLLLSYMLVLIKAFAVMPLIAIQTGNIHLNWVRLYYALLTMGLVIQSNFQRIRPFFINLKNNIAPAEALWSRAPKKFIMIPLLAAAFITSSAVATMPDSRLHVSFLDVGEGDAVLIQAAGQNILVDGGLSPQVVCHAISNKLPFWNREIDLIILSHPHLDHLSGLVEVLKRYQVKGVLAPNLYTENPLFQEWLAVIKSKNIPISYADRGQRIALNNGAAIEILNPVFSNTPGDDSVFESQGIVLKVTQGQHSFLLTADIDKETELQLLQARQDMKCTILKAAHHGSYSSTSSEFLSASQPQYAVISSGADNTFGHPSPAVLQRLSNQTVYRTDTSGTIEFTTDGKKMWLKKAR